MNIGKAVGLAIQYYHSGDSQQAETICRRILRKKPNNADALHCLGLIYFQRGEHERALHYLQKVLQIDPHYADAYNNLGNIFQEVKQPDEAIACYHKALRLNPHLPTTYYNLGICLHEKGERNEAIECYQKALRLNQNTFGLFNNLGLALHEKGEYDDALSCYRNAIRLNPHFAEAHYNLANVLRDKGQPDDAISHYQHALQINPEYVDAYINLGIVLKDKGQLDEAIILYEKALHIDPKNEKAYFNLGFACGEAGEIDEAIAYYQKALLNNPDFADAQWNLSLALLSTGNFEAGWEKYEWRWKTEENTSRRYDFPQSLWDGSSLRGKSVFVYGEQGIGDEIMFAHCLQEIAQQADVCIVACEKRLVPLFHRSFPDCSVIEHFDPNDAYPATLPPVHCKIALGSLPKFLRSTLGSFREQTKYLIADVQKYRMWHDRFISLGEGLKVGISWRGGKKLYEKLSRSTILEQWAQLLSMQGIHYINLQYGDCNEELRQAREKLGVTIFDWEDADPLKDLDNFAAQISALDLVISVDNATVHMAGALGVPVWTLLPFVSNWRWMRKFEDTPWYPTMRLFRQSSPKNWDDVFYRVSVLLQDTIDRGDSLSDRLKFSIQHSYKNEKNTDSRGSNIQTTLSNHRNYDDCEKKKYEKAWGMNNRIYANYSPGLELSKHINFLEFFRANHVKSVLDAGIGSGKLCNKMINMGFDCFGLDIADNCLDEDLFPLKDNILTVGTLWDSTVYKENQFDACVCMDVLEHIPTNYIDDVLFNLLLWTKKYIFFADCTLPGLIWLKSRPNSPLNGKAKSVVG